MFSPISAELSSIPREAYMHEAWERESEAKREPGTSTPRAAASWEGEDMMIYFGKHVHGSAETWERDVRYRKDTEFERGRARRGREERGDQVARRQASCVT